MALLNRDDLNLHRFIVNITDKIKILVSNYPQLSRGLWFQNGGIS